MTDAAENSTPEEEKWDGPKYEATLAYLEKLQEQMDSLRSVLPSVVEPLKHPDVGKTKLLEKIKAVALQSTSDLKSFRETWSSEHTQELFSRSRESYQKDNDLSKALNVPRYGWTEEQ